MLRTGDKVKHRDFIGLNGQRFVYIAIPDTVNCYFTLKKTQGKIVIESGSVNLTEFKRKPDDPSEVSCTVYVDTANRNVYYRQDESDVLECTSQVNYFGGVCISRHSN